jgi:hypothetical protein
MQRSHICFGRLEAGYLSFREEVKGPGPRCYTGPFILSFVLATNEYESDSEATKIAKRKRAQNAPQKTQAAGTTRARHPTPGTAGKGTAKKNAGFKET